MAVYKNLSTKELYASIPSTTFVAEMMKNGMKMGSTQLAISAMEELIVRGDTDIVTEGLKYGFDAGYITLGSSMSALIARSLSESCRGSDPFLQRFGKFLFRAKSEDPFKEFIETGAHMRKASDLLEGTNFVWNERPAPTE